MQVTVTSADGDLVAQIRVEATQLLYSVPTQLQHQVRLGIFTFLSLK